MQRKSIESSISVKSVGYDAESQTLEVEFKSHSLNSTEAIYRYRDVPEKVYKALMESESVGRYMAKEIRGKFYARFVNPEDEA